MSGLGGLASGKVTETQLGVGLLQLSPPSMRKVVSEHFCSLILILLVL